jgi:hypothetical protein
MNRKNPKRLTLNRETLRRLQDSKLRQVAGGRIRPDYIVTALCMHTKAELEDKWTNVVSQVCSVPCGTMSCPSEPTVGL